MITTRQPHAPTRKPSVEQQVHQTVQQRLNGSQYAFLFCKVSCQIQDGHLTLRGCVPTFYLKQVLQELLRGIEHVERIRNEVDVVSSTGLSSAAAK